MVVLANLKILSYSRKTKFLKVVSNLAKYEKSLALLNLKLLFVKEIFLSF